MLVQGELENVPLLEVLQVVSYSKQSGLLSVDGADIRGVVVFDEGGLVCAESSSTRALVARAATETDLRTRAALRRISALAALTELLALKAGIFRFRRDDAPVAEVSGVPLRTFYESGVLDAGELLLMIATSIDKIIGNVDGTDEKTKRSRPVADTADSIRRDGQGERPRSHPRFSPTLIPAVVEQAGAKLGGHLTNVSEGGGFFHGHELPVRDAPCRIRFSLPGAYGVVEASAQVAWIRTEGGAVERGAGLSFLEMSDDARGRLNAYLQHYQRLADEYRASGSGSAEESLHR